MQPHVIEKRIELNAPVTRVWRALTDSREFGEWFKVKLDTPFEVGKEAHGQITHPGYEHVTWRGVVVDITPMTRFAFTWHPYAVDPKKDYSAEPPTLVEFLLEPKGSKTVLTVRETGFEKVPADRRDEAFRMNEQGWAGQIKNIERHVGTERVGA